MVQSPVLHAACIATCVFKRNVVWKPELMLNSMRTKAKSVLLKQSMFTVSAEQEHNSGACSICIAVKLCHQQKDDLSTATTCSRSSAWRY